MQTLDQKEAFLRSWFDVPENVHWAHGMSNEVEKEVSESFDRAIAAWNTRPAAPVEGLETVLERPYLGSLVTRSQAVAIIAARDAEIERLQKINAMIMGDDENAPRYTTKRLKQEVERVTQVMRGEAADREAHVKNLQANNAALTARVKALVDENFQHCQTNERLGAKLANAGKCAQEALLLIAGDESIPGHIRVKARAALEDRL